MSAARVALLFFCLGFSAFGENPLPCAASFSAWFTRLAQGEALPGLWYFALRAHDVRSRLTYSLLDHHQNSSTHGWAGPGKAGPFQIRVGRLLGFGAMASVYEGEISGLRAVDSWVPRPKKLALKFGHRLGFGLALPIHGDSLNREKQVYDLVSGNLSRMEAEPDFPKDPAWGKGRIPTIPLAGPYDTVHGSLLVKPVVKGMSISDLYSKYRPGSPEALPEEVQRGLEDFLKFVQIAHRVIPGPASDGKLRIDVNPNNLVWVSDPEQMRQLGMSRPGFTTYELGEVPAYIGVETMTPQIYRAWVFNHMRSRSNRGDRR